MNTKRLNFDEFAKHIKFQPYEFQKRLIEHLDNNRCTIATKFMHGGFTTTVLLWQLWRCLFNKDEHCAYVSKTDSEACISWQIVNTAIQNLPQELYPRMSKNCEHRINFSETGSYMIFGLPERYVGYSMNNVFIDDAAYADDLGKYYASWKPIILSVENSKVVVLSNPVYKDGWFYKLCQEALVDKNDFSVFKADYTEHPEFNTIAWVNKTRDQLGDKCWRQEVLQEFAERPKLAVDEFREFRNRSWYNKNDALLKEFGW